MPTSASSITRTSSGALVSAASCRATSSAADRVREILSESGKSYLRVGVVNGGCAGMEYTMEIAAAAGPLDEVIEQDGARVMIAPMAQMFLFGTEIDYETSLLESGFKFNNPNVAEACGCGESIKFKDAPGQPAEG